MESRQGSDLESPCMQSKLEIYLLRYVKPLKMFKQGRNSQIKKKIFFNIAVWRIAMIDTRV